MPQVAIGVVRNGDWNVAVGVAQFSEGNDVLLQPHTSWNVPPSVGFLFVLLVIFIFFRRVSEGKA